MIQIEDPLYDYTHVYDCSTPIVALFFFFISNFGTHP